MTVMLVQNYFDIAKYLSGATTDPSNPLSDVTGVVAGYSTRPTSYAAPWTFSEEIKVAFDAKTRSDFGVIETYARLVIEFGLRHHQQQRAGCDRADRESR